MGRRRGGGKVVARVFRRGVLRNSEQLHVLRLAERIKGERWTNRCFSAYLLITAMAPGQTAFAFRDDVVERTETTSTFQDNLSLPIHRWFRYSAGFSALWAGDLIQKELENGRRHVLDPFAGSGTVLLEGEARGVDAIGIEAHPFVARIARAKLAWRGSPKEFKDFALQILEDAKSHQGNPVRHAPLIHKCFPTPVLARLDALRTAWERLADDSPISELSWLTITSILRECSPVGTAQWQYVLPNKKKARIADPFSAFESKVYLLADDILQRQHQDVLGSAILFEEDARECPSVPDDWANLIITSPPYSNNFDYADATRLEMTFWGEIKCWGDLQETVRSRLIRSCTQHVAPLCAQTSKMLRDALLSPIHDEIAHVCGVLEKEREKHGGKKTYHTMVAAYFLDLARVWQTLRRVARKNCLVCFVVGDSAPYGVHVPVDTWLGKLAFAAGFKSFHFEKIRDRNIKWKNRKHRVPLHEGRLWVEG